LIFYFSGVSKRGRGRAITGESWDVDPIGKGSSQRNSDDRMRLSIQAMWGKKGLFSSNKKRFQFVLGLIWERREGGRLRFPSE